MNQTFSIWGMKDIEEIMVDDKIFWKTTIHNPFKEDNHYKIGLNEKFLRTARQKGVEKIILIIGQRETMMSVPTEKMLKEKVKKGEFEDKPSIFENSAAMRIFYFVI